MNTKPIEAIDPELVLPAVGAMIFASDEPADAAEIAAALGGPSVEAVEQAVQSLAERLDRASFGLRIERVAGGYRMSTASDVGPWLRQFFQRRNRSRLSPGALETLASVAYRQPITAPEIQAIRGKDPTAALRGLLEKRLIRILGRKKVVGNPLLYGTPREFLVHFGLNSLEDLPPIDGFESFAAALAAPNAEGELDADGADLGGRVEDGDLGGTTVPPEDR